jgi:ABC-2 type transport system ATP-binding protein
MLVTEHLTKDYRRHRALEDLNLHVAQGEIFGLLGPNGSGKSTTLRLLMGFLRPTAGRAAIGGHDCWRDSVAVRRLVAYLPGELRLYENLTGKQLLHFLSGLRRQSLGSRCEELARRLDIDLNRPIANLSSGMKRKLALVQVLLPQARLLILDEPTNTLDPAMRDELLEQLVQAKKGGQTILFSSHVLQEVERVCDRVGILCRGRLVHLQKMSDLRQVRLARVRLADTFQSPASVGTAGPDPAETRLPPGLVLREQNGRHLSVECQGDLGPLLHWLVGQPVADLRIEPLGLGPIYRRYHGGES